MGRITTFLTILICLDMLFVITGQMCAGGTTSCGFTSAIFGFALHPSTTTASVWFLSMIGDVQKLLAGQASPGAIGSLFGNLATAAISIGALFFGLKNSEYLWMGTGFALSLLVNDFGAYFAYFSAFSPILAMLIFSPIMVIFIFTVVEWVRGIP